MKHKAFVGLVGVAWALAAVATSAQAQNALVTIDKLPPTGGFLPADNAPTWKWTPGKTDGAPNTLQTPMVADGPHDQPATVLRVQTDVKRYSQRSGAELYRPLGGVILPGQAALVVFWARCIATLDETGEARARLKLVTGQWYGAQISVSVGKKWERITFPFVPFHAYKPDDRFSFFFDTGQQTIEIARVQVLNYENKVAPGQLPQHAVSYQGRALDAPWRKAAQERIEQIRKGELAVVVTDGAGKPLFGARVHARLTRNAFHFGTAWAPHEYDGQKWMFGEQTKRSPAYVAQSRAMLLKYFNTVYGGDIGWAGWERRNLDPDRTRYVNMVKWLREQGKRVHAHVLFWPDWQYAPKSIDPIRGDRAALRQATFERLDDMAAQYKGLYADWNVTNELSWANNMLPALGEDIVAEWYKRLRRREPGARLFYNEAIGLSWGKTHDDLERRVRTLREQGAPIDAIGIEAHHGYSATAPETVYKTLDRLGTLAKHLEITEYDMDSLDEPLQADYLRDLLTVCYSHPSVTGFAMWGFNDKDHWKGNAPLFRSDWSPKPALALWQNLIFKQWMTDVQGATDRQGRFQTRGFVGDYEVTVTHNNKTNIVAATLPKKGQTVMIRFP